MLSLSRAATAAFGSEISPRRRPARESVGRTSSRTATHVNPNAAAVRESSAPAGTPAIVLGGGVTGLASSERLAAQESLCSSAGRPPAVPLSLVSPSAGCPREIQRPLDELMAVALASGAHAERHPRSPINSVFVEELDPLASSALDDIPAGELINLNEWR